MSETQLTLCCFLLLLAPLSCAGLALVNTGLGRARNAAHAMMAALCAIGVAVCVYAILGRCWVGSSGEAARSIVLAGKPWNWLGAVAPFLSGLAPGAEVLLSAWMGLVSVSLAVLIPLGTGMERWRLSAVAASSAIFAGLIYPVFAHWVWGGGWLAQLGVNYGLGAGYMDAGGAGTIHVTGGLTALTIAWIVGPRRGKYGHDGMPMAIPGHNVVFTLFGCFVALVGWLGLNGAGAILFSGMEPGRLPFVAINTILGACSAALAAAAITRIRFGRPDASLTANGWVGGLVATSAACAWLPPAAALIVGLAAGALVTLSVELLELRLDVDDPGGSVSVHAVAGIWGLLATGMFARIPGNAPGQFLAQVVGVSTLLGFVLPVAWGLNHLLNRVMPLRVQREGERQGMDLFELGAGAYPDFMTHSEDHMQR